jgi:thiol-disulfide isomerase/thioredoxin
MRLSTVLSGAVFTVFLGVGCSSSSTTPATTGPAPAQDKGVDPGTGATPTPAGVGQGTEVNPYGVAYPTANLGHDGRAGARAGRIIRNYTFLGSRAGDPSKGATVVSLADFFDPEMKTVKLIHFSAGAIWCPPCNQEADVLVPMVPGLKDKKVFVIQALIEGAARGTGSVLTDLDVWQKKHKINYTIFLDPEQQNLGQFFDAAAIPWNSIIDARSMEILSSGVGYNPQISDEYDTWLKWIDANPPQATK